LPEICPQFVVDTNFIDNNHYNLLLSRSVVVNYMFGAAASNVIVESLTRGTPIICNRLPATEEYLGKDYPLFFDDSLDGLLTRERLDAASLHLLSRKPLLPSCQDFCYRIRDFALTMT
jgi:hypothetical protein